MLWLIYMCTKLCYLHVYIVYAQMHLMNSNAEVSIKVRGLNFVQSLHIHVHPYLAVYEQQRLFVIYEM